MARLRLTTMPARLYRISRTPDPAQLPPWEARHDDGTFGNRWDDPVSRYRLLYTADTFVGALVETLQAFRRDLNLIAREDSIEDDGDLAPHSGGSGIVPRSFFEGRYAGELVVVKRDGCDSRFVDVADIETIQYLRSHPAIAAAAVEHGLSDVSLDVIVGKLLSPNARAMTQRISRLVYDESARYPRTFGTILARDATPQLYSL